MVERSPVKALKLVNIFYLNQIIFEHLFCFQGIALLIEKRCATGGMKEAWIILIGYSGKGLLLVLTQDLAKTIQVEN